MKIKLQVSTREYPILPVAAVPQIEQDYFRLLPYKPAPIPCLGFEEIIAEKIRAASQRSKIRAASQRSKIRDLHDLSELATRPLERKMIRSLVVLKLWNSGQELDYEQFRARIMQADDYDLADLSNLLRKDERPDLEAKIRRVVDGYRFLADLSDLERAVVADSAKRRSGDAEALIAIISGGNRQ